MSRPLFTGSTYHRVQSCPASAVLPGIGHEVGDGGVGNVIHRHMQLRVERTIDEAVAALPGLCAAERVGEKEAGIATARCMSFEYTPPAGALAEVSLALFDDGHVERVQGGRGSYDLPKGAFFAMTVDCLWAEPAGLQPAKPQDGRLSWACPEGSVLWVPDWKAGQDQYVEPVEHNAQVRAGALLASKWTGAKVVMPAIVFVRKGQGEWDVPEQPLGPADLKEIEAQLFETQRRVEMALADYTAGQQPELTEGSWCLFCPAQSRCPAKTAMIRAAIDGDLLPASQVAAGLTATQAVRLAAVLPQLEAFVRKGKQVLRQIAEEQGPIDLGHGLVYGPHPHVTMEIKPDVGVEVLAAEIGHEAAEAALTVSLPRTGIERAVKNAHEAAGIERQASKVVRRVMGKIKEAGGLVPVTDTWCSAYRPQPVDATIVGDDVDE